MTDKYVRSLRGPVLLMTLGALMMMDHHGRLGIGDSWPVLLVVYGLMILLERLLAPGAAAGGPFA